MAIIGLDIGGTKILGATFDKNGTIIDKEKLPSLGENGFDAVLTQIHSVLDTLISRSSEPIIGIGVGVPGAIDQQGVVLFTPNLPIKNFDLTTHLREKYNVTACISNDVNLGTYGEYAQLQLPYKNVIGLFPGTGLGGGIIINGELYIGKGSAGELGHMVVEEDGLPCGCGNKGCLEMYASKKGIITYLKSQIKKGKHTLLKDAVKEGIIKSSQLRKAYYMDDKLTVKAMERFTHHLGIGVGSIINIFNPDLIIIGGGIIESFGDELLKEIKKHAKKHAMSALYKDTIIQSSNLADDAVIYGGYHLVKNVMK